VNTKIETFMVLMILADMALLGMSRLAAAIRVVAAQGILLGGFALFANAGDLGPRMAAIAIGGAVIKGLVFPFLLLRAVREANTRREMEPFVGYVLSIGIGILLLFASAWLSRRITVPARSLDPIVVTGALMTMFTGLFLVMARKKALTQVLGYLVFENGIYIFGVSAVGEIPALVELGVLLDAFVAVFVMVIALYHINREFDHIDADRLDALKG
jgi:hydrogenase-4 component E